MTMELRQNMYTPWDTQAILRNLTKYEETDSRKLLSVKNSHISFEHVITAENNPSILSSIPPSTHPSILSFLHPPIHPFFHSSIHPSLHPCFHSSIHKFISFMHVFHHSALHPSLHPLLSTHQSIISFILSFICPFTQKNSTKIIDMEHFIPYVLYMEK